MSKSYHIFYFPFIVKHGGAENAIVKALNSSNFGKLWKRAPQVYKTEEYYDEKMYYHHFVHNALYDNGKNLFYTTFSQKKKESNSDYSLVLHFERTDVLSNQLKFRIKAKGEELFNLDIDKITLDYYFTNIGILSLYINNDKYLSQQDILDINYYGRALYNLIDKEKICNAIYGPKYETLKYDIGHQELYNLYGHIRQVLDEFFVEAKINVSSVQYLPVFDNKMFVNCCYLNSELSNKYKKDSIQDLSDEMFWQNYVEIDHDCDFGCQNFEMRKSLTQKDSYLRWQGYGTLYGITDRSFVCLCSSESFSKTVLLPHMQTIYSQMVKLVLVQRASLLAFSDSISRVNFNIDNIEAADIIGNIYRNYIVYIKKLYFVNVTSQVQGVELYEKLHNTFNIKEHIESFDNELSKMNIYLSSLKDSEKRESQNNLFNLLAGLFLPATLVSGILGMNNILTDNKFFIGKWGVTFYEKRYILHDLAIVLLASMIFWFIMVVSNKTAKSIVRSNRIAFIIVAILTLAFFIICLLFSINWYIEK